MDYTEARTARDPPKHFTIIYIDDCLVVTASYATHVRALKRFLEASAAEKMWVNTKAVFAAKTISFVGFCVSYDGIACNPDKVEAIYGMPDAPRQ